MENVWHHRKVAETAARACNICFKPSASVLITPDNKDYFYVCPAHLKDRNFAVPTDDEAKAIEQRRKDEEMEREIETIKREYEERMKRKREKRKEKDAKKESSDAKTKDDEKSDATDEKEKNEKIKALANKQEANKIDEGPRVFKLQKHFYQMRLDKMRNTELAKRNRDRLKNPTAFPSVPSDDL